MDGAEGDVIHRYGRAAVAHNKLCKNSIRKLGIVWDNWSWDGVEWEFEICVFFFRCCCCVCCVARVRGGVSVCVCVWVRVGVV